MLELCPAGEERSKFFAFHYLHRLPQELRIMLGDDDHQDVQTLAAKADRLWALHGHHLHGGVAAVQQAPSDPAVNAVRGGGTSSRCGGQAKGNRGGRAQLPRHNAGRAAQQPPKGVGESSSAPAALARESAGLCYYHWNFGEQAIKCKAPCSWQGN